MKFPDNIPVFGDTSFRGECDKEDAELITFFAELKRHYPALAKVAIHPDNEGRVTGSGFAYHSRQKAKGAVNKGAADIFIVGCPAFVCELKRRDHTKSQWQTGQQEFLQASLEQGAFVCVALGWQAAMLAVVAWQEGRQRSS